MSLLGSGSIHMTERFRKPRSGAGTAAAANAVCQRCLQKGHFTFQCKNQAVYHVRPSRTQQLLNPKVRRHYLAPSELLDEDKPRQAKTTKKRRRDKSSSSSSSSDSSSSDDSSSSSDSGSSSSSSSDSSSSGTASSGSDDSSGTSSSGASSSSSDSSSSDSSSSDSDDSSSGSERKLRRRGPSHQRQRGRPLSKPAARRYAGSPSQHGRYVMESRDSGAHLAAANGSSSRLKSVVQVPG
eukprot:jgi/Astpho2/387/Aster-x0437